MCRSCWEEAGAPDHRTPDIDRAVHLINQIYRTEPTGCPLHVELDDWNVHDPAAFAPYGDPEDLEDPAAWDLAVELCVLLNRMPETDRYAALGHADRYTPNRHPATFDPDRDLPPDGAVWSGVAPGLKDVQTWTFTFPYWTSGDGASLIAARWGDPAGAGITRCWIADPAWGAQ
jgi:hypothetical protein